MKTATYIFLAIFLSNLMACAQNKGKEGATNPNTNSNTKTMNDTVVKTDEEWKKILTPEQYRVTREAGTERAFSGALWDNKKKGTYYCICCDNPLFSSDTKFESSCGWPSFFAPLNKEHVKENVDRGFGMVRTEVVCNRCGAHLGHVFEDGPKPTGLRYCMNSASMKFKEDK